jgi:hypothetical protein
MDMVDRGALRELIDDFPLLVNTEDIPAPCNERCDGPMTYIQYHTQECGPAIGFKTAEVVKTFFKRSCTLQTTHKLPEFSRRQLQNTIASHDALQI